MSPMPFGVGSCEDKHHSSVLPKLASCLQCLSAWGRVRTYELAVAYRHDPESPMPFGVGSCEDENRFSAFIPLTLSPMPFGVGSCEDLGRSSKL